MFGNAIAHWPVCYLEIPNGPHVRCRKREIDVSTLCGGLILQELSSWGIHARGLRAVSSTGNKIEGAFEQNM